MPNKTKSLTSLFDLKILNILFFSFAYATDNKISPEDINLIQTTHSGVRFLFWNKNWAHIPDNPHNVPAIKANKVPFIVLFLEFCCLKFLNQKGMLKI